MNSNPTKQKHKILKKLNKTRVSSFPNTLHVFLWKWYSWKLRVYLEIVLFRFLDKTSSRQYVYKWRKGKTFILSCKSSLHFEHNKKYILEYYHFIWWYLQLSCDIIRWLVCGGKIEFFYNQKNSARLTIQIRFRLIYFN